MMPEQKCVTIRHTNSGLRKEKSPCHPLPAQFKVVPGTSSPAQKHCKSSWLSCSPVAVWTSGVFPSLCLQASYSRCTVLFLQLLTGRTGDPLHTCPGGGSGLTAVDRSRKGCPCWTSSCTGGVWKGSATLEPSLLPSPLTVPKVQGPAPPAPTAGKERRSKKGGPSFQVLLFKYSPPASLVGAALVARLNPSRFWRLGLRYTSTHLEVHCLLRINQRM